MKIIKQKQNKETSENAPDFQEQTGTLPLYQTTRRTNGCKVKQVRKHTNPIAKQMRSRNKLILKKVIPKAKWDF